MVRGIERNSPKWFFLMAMLEHPLLSLPFHLRHLDPANQRGPSHIWVVEVRHGLYSSHKGVEPFEKTEMPQGRLGCLQRLGSPMPWFSCFLIASPFGPQEVVELGFC